MPAVFIANKAAVREGDVEYRGGAVRGSRIAVATEGMSLASVAQDVMYIRDAEPLSPMLAWCRCS
jgi:hypothetical protein